MSEATSQRNSATVHKWKRYPKYKDSGVEWLGEIPENWTLDRAKFLFRKMNRPIRECDEIVTAFRDGEVTLRKKRRTEGFTNSLQEIGYQGVRKGDLVIHGMDGFAGAIGVSDSDGKSTPVYSVCLPAYPGKIDNYYYARLLRHAALSGYIQSLARGIRERSTEFRYDELGQLFLPSFPHSEQVKISSFLDHKTAHIDSLIAKKEWQIELLKEKRVAFISHLVTKGLNPNVKCRESGVVWLGMLPEHWSVKKISRVKSYSKYAISMGPFGSDIKTDNFVESGIPLIQGNNLTNLHVQDDNIVFITEEKANELIFANAYSLDIVLTHRGTIGQASIIPDNSKYSRYVISQSQMKVTFDFSIIYPFFINYYLNSKNGQYSLLIRKAQTGIPAIGQPVTTLKSILIPIPPKNEQIEITNYLKNENARINKFIEKIRHSIDLLKEYRIALISAAVTGKIDVRAEGR